MGNETFSAVFDSDVFQVKKIVGEALRFLTGVFPGLSEAVLFDVKLVLSEALNNAVSHGNKRSARKKVNLKITVCGGPSITIIIGDEGAGFDYNSVLDRKMTDESLMNESGRGIRLVHSLSDEVSYNSKGNEIKIIKKVVVNGQNSGGR